MGNRNRSAAANLTDPPSLTAVDDDGDDTRADDPVSKVMGDAGPLELGDVDPYADDYEAEVPGVLPATFDVFAVKPEVIERVRANGDDPTVVRICVVPVIRGKRRTAIKNLRPESVTWERIQQHLAPGTYDLQAFNDRSTYMGGKRIRVDPRNVDDLDDLEDWGDAGSTRRRSGRSMNPGDRLMYELAMRSVRGGDSGGRANELSSAIADFAKLMALQTQAATAQMTAQMKMLEVDSKRARGESSSQLNTFRTLLEIVDRRTPKRSAGAGAKVEDVIGLLQLGMHFQKAMSDGTADDDGDKLGKWVNSIMPLVDSVGPQLVGLIAMALPNDKAELVMEMVQEHIKSREAGATDDDESPTIDTTAEEVGKAGE